MPAVCRAVAMRVRRERREGVRRPEVEEWPGFGSRGFTAGEERVGVRRVNSISKPRRMVVCVGWKVSRTDLRRCRGQQRVLSSSGEDGVVR